MASLSVRAVDPDNDEISRWLDLTALQFRHAATAHPDQLAFSRPGMRGERVSAAVNAADEIVGTFRSWDTQLTVPGGATVTADAISAVTVHPTYRRQGALTAMMIADLEAAAGRGTPVAVLIASEAAIYGRFGFAPATQTATWEVDCASARLRPGLRAGGTVEVVPDVALRDIAPEIYARCRRPGAIDRKDRWWDLGLGIVEWPGDKPTPSVGALYRDADGVPQGYALWTAKDDWENRLSRTVVTVRQLQAVTDEAYVGLWTHLIELDLVSGLRAEELAVDEPLPWLLTDGRRARMTSRVDFQWSRLLDPAAALSARTYAVPASSIAFAVTDAQGWAAGTYVLEVDEAGRGLCTRTTGTTGTTGTATAPPEVTVDVTALSGAWLGGGDLGACRVAGTATEHTPGAVDRLTTILRTPRAPWTAVWF